MGSIMPPLYGDNSKDEIVAEIERLKKDRDRIDREIAELEAELEK